MTTHYDLYADMVYGGVPHLPAPGEEVLCGSFGFFGGGSYITAVAAARLGLRVAVLSPFGTGVLEQMVKGWLQDEGVDTRWAFYPSHPMPYVTVAINHGGDRGFLTYQSPENEHYAAHCLDVMAHISAKWLHLGARRGIRPLIEMAQRRSMAVSTAVGWDPEWLTDPELLRLIALSHLFMANRQEAEAITATHSIGDAAASLSRYVRHFVITDAERGGVFQDAESPIGHYEATPAAAVDTTGAGDNFAAGILAGLINGASLGDAVRLGSLCGQQSVLKLGGTTNSPTLSEANQYLVPFNWQLRHWEDRAL